jgi:predicted transcriptional regulator
MSQMKRAESFAAVLNDYLARGGVSEREFISCVGVHPITFAEIKSGADPCNETILKNIVTRLRLDREWAARFYVALLAERDGEVLLRAAGFIE